MAKKEEVKVEPMVSHQQEQRYFPLFSILIGIVCVALAVVLYLNFFQIPPLGVNIVLLLAGLIILKLSFETGFEHKRKAILKKYL